MQAVVTTEERSVLVAAGHRLTRCDELHLADLADEHVLEPPDGALGIGRRIADMEELLTRVAAGDAVAIVPEGAGRGYGLTAVALADAPPSQIVVVAREPLRPATMVFVDAVRAPLRLAA